MISLKIALKWVFFLFCIVFTFQVIFIIGVIGGLLYTYLGSRELFSRSYILSLMFIALASALPVLIFAQCRILSWMPIRVRRVFHFLLTFGAVYGLLIYFGWYDVSGRVLVPLVLFFAIYISAIFIYGKYSQKKSMAQQNAENQKYLQYYTAELEHYQLGVRRFRHDYQNILLSLDSYIEDGDLAGLRQYYYSSIKPASDIIIKNNFALDGLDKIKIPAIKSFLFSKLMLAQNADADIRVTFEANKDIDHISLNHVALVRMLGILIDNAIEELTELGRGELFISCLKWDAGITFVVQNTCRTDLPSSQQLWQAGFSTKGEDRGLGLSNLSELAYAYPNVTLSTKVSENSFRQELLIEAAERE